MEMENQKIAARLKQDMPRGDTSVPPRDKKSRNQSSYLKETDIRAR
jgi:hypothetical protein